MTPAVAWGGPIGVFIVCWFLTGRLRQYAVARRLVDVPNARSSHRVATPRGGGAAIVLAVSLALIWRWWSGGPDVLPVGVLAGGWIVAGVGFIDDHGHVHPSIRLASHTLAAVLAVAGFSATFSGVWSATLAVFFVTWMINLTNFMDGIDGLAGAQTATICGAGAVLTCLVVPGTANWFEPAVLAAASLGFLVWNWPPARIFMGDVGSGYVGFMIAALTLRAAAIAPELGASWVILSGVFLADATVTLARRAVRRERLVEAHRSHAYQRLAQAWGAHRPVTLLITGINLSCLAPVAALVATGSLSRQAGLSVVFVPLMAGVWMLGAGLPTRGRTPDSVIDGDERRL